MVQQQSIKYQLPTQSAKNLQWERIQWSNEWKEGGSRCRITTKMLDLSSVCIEHTVFFTDEFII